ncbi:MAG: hypothetical protein ICV63_13370 [Coleofasciculus sp. Co-bin14]|nr:hypothetical protein [Coleofasciculus sp. Co-bin14]
MTAPIEPAGTPIAQFHLKHLLPSVCPRCRSSQLLVTDYSLIAHPGGDWGVLDYDLFCLDCHESLSDSTVVAD